VEIDTVVVCGQNNSIVRHAATERAVRIFRAYFHALTDASSHAESSMNEFGSDTDEFESGYHLLPHFNSNTNTNPNLLEYEYKTDGSNSNSHSDVYSESTRNYFPKI
jgi:hypothetical protein